MIISLIAAMDKNRLIGVNNQLPWHLPADLAYFKRTTLGKPVLMGRKTYESIGRPLPGRTNLVLTRNDDYKPEGIISVSSLDEAISRIADAEELVIMGGSSVYEMLLPEVERMYLTYVQAEFEGDAWFPEFEDSDWKEVSAEEHYPDEKNNYACRFVTLERF